MTWRGARVRVRGARMGIGMKGAHARPSGDDDGGGGERESRDIRDEWSMVDVRRRASALSTSGLILIFLPARRHTHTSRWNIASRRFILPRKSHHRLTARPEYWNHADRQSTIDHRESTIFQLVRRGSPLRYVQVRRAARHARARSEVREGGRLRFTV